MAQLLEISGDEPKERMPSFRLSSLKPSPSLLSFRPATAPPIPLPHPRPTSRD
ncbi:hypothetical protein GBA52_010020 [Prunus armeniaca]|nr:hypothetical protein GBA52_010020 [Prunus armeniaca]